MASLKSPHSEVIRLHYSTIMNLIAVLERYERLGDSRLSALLPRLQRAQLAIIKRREAAKLKHRSEVRPPEWSLHSDETKKQIGDQTFFDERERAQQLPLVDTMDPTAYMPDDIEKIFRQKQQRAAEVWRRREFRMRLRGKCPECKKSLQVHPEEAIRCSDDDHCQWYDRPTHLP